MQKTVWSSGEFFVYGQNGRRLSILKIVDIITTKRYYVIYSVKNMSIDPKILSSITIN